MVKRAFDLVLGLLLLACSAPLLLLAALGVRLSSPGPVVFRATRVGRGGARFVMHKFRTMHAARDGAASVITASRDPRVFAFGAFLRKTKLDELPQLFDVLRGHMSLVGPRPEDPRIVERHYNEEYRETLRVLPGLASPGSIYNYTHASSELAGGDPEALYVTRVLPIKMALERVYVQRASFWYDLRILARTAWIILAIACGRAHFADPPEMALAEREGWLPDQRPSDASKP
jgi:lipopolysaccharide/colanic/teichoic acid biosynthesis glycosyltransferase